MNINLTDREKDVVLFALQKLVEASTDLVNESERVIGKLKGPLGDDWASHGAGYVFSPKEKGENA